MADGTCHTDVVTTHIKNNPKKWSFVRLVGPKNATLAVEPTFFRKGIALKDWQDYLLLDPDVEPPFRCGSVAVQIYAAPLKKKRAAVHPQIGVEDRVALLCESYICVDPTEVSSFRFNLKWVFKDSLMTENPSDVIMDWSG